MNKEFVPYEEALALKELGFDEVSIGHYYIVDGVVMYFDTLSSETNERLCKKENFIKAPTYSQAFRWFREEHNIDCYIEKDRKNRYWFYITVNTLINKSSKFCYHRYEKAELACLRKLIEIVNQNKNDKAPEN